MRRRGRVAGAALRACAEQPCERRAAGRASAHVHEEDEISIRGTCPQRGPRCRPLFRTQSRSTSSCFTGQTSGAGWPETWGGALPDLKGTAEGRGGERGVLNLRPLRRDLEIRCSCFCGHFLGQLAADSTPESQLLLPPQTSAGRGQLRSSVWRLERRNAAQTPPPLWRLVYIQQSKILAGLAGAAGAAGFRRQSGSW